MRLRIGTPRCLLVIAPHPDDETIGAFGLITRLRRRGVAVRVLVVTDGHASHRNSRAWPGARLVAERQRETRRALRPIGVSAGDIAFLRFPDGDLERTSNSARRCIIAAVRRAPKPLLVVAPGSGDNHPDHRVVAACVASARVNGVRALAYPVWPAGKAVRRSRTLTLSTQERFAKRRAIRSYRTQAGRIIDDPEGFAMTSGQIAAFSRPTEHFVESRR
ncbi:PIG-L family deacetylase [Sphingomonas koreensis]|nr:PIG-L family deacetylase [Sphingomonas koreensis]